MMLRLASQVGTDAAVSAAESGTSASSWLILGLLAVSVIGALKFTHRKTGDNDTSVPRPPGTEGHAGGNSVVY